MDTGDWVAIYLAGVPVALGSLLIFLVGRAVRRRRVRS
jgi:hypothetical protein